MKSLEVGILDLGLGSLASLKLCLQRAGITASICHKAVEIPPVLILPGVGHFSFGSQQLDTTGARDLIMAHWESGGSVIGICLGMQLLGISSEEGEGAGLGLLDFQCKRVADDSRSLPVIGWQTPGLLQKDWLGRTGQERYYFLHDYGLKPSGQHYEQMLHLNYVRDPIVSAIESDRLIGFQFHPERSLEFGQAILLEAVKRLTL